MSEIKSCCWKVLMQSTACSPISSEFRFKANTIEMKTNKKEQIYSQVILPNQIPAKIS